MTSAAVLRARRTPARAGTAPGGAGLCAQPERHSPAVPPSSTGATPLLAAPSRGSSASGGCRQGARSRGHFWNLGGAGATRPAWRDRLQSRAHAEGTGSLIWAPGRMSYPLGKDTKHTGNKPWTPRPCTYPLLPIVSLPSALDENLCGKISVLRS
jgi:hypothetical protein